MNITFRKYYLPLFLIFTSFFSTHQISYPTDTLNNSLIFRDNDSSTLISSNGNFELGFFSPGNSKNRYVGIWYKKIPVETVVWVANRDNPLTERSGVLRVEETGILALLNATGGTMIWSTNASTTVQTPVAQLLDSGNLVVKDANDDNPENFLWQSFDHPADTLLPGMKLGVNFQTGRDVYITSPKNSGDPASGDFTYHCDPSGYPQNVIKGGGGLRYSSGPWNGQSFTGSNTLRKNPIYTFGVVINKKEAYYQTELLNDSVYSRFTISDTGVGQRWIWEYPKQSWTIYLTIPSDNCDIYNVCGPHSNCNIENTPSCGCLDKFKPKDPEGWDSGARSGGCIRSTPLNCENGDAFLKYSEIKLPNTQHSWYNTTMTLEECKVVCLNNCSCMAYTSLDISRGGNGCLLWFGELVDIKKVSPGQDIYIRIASSELGSGGSKRKILIVVFSLVTGILLLSLGLSLMFYLKKRKRINQQLLEIGRMRVNNVDNHPAGVSHNEELDLPLFDLSTICKATDNFSINNKLGQGGFGPVYKGVLEDGQEIAVKRLSKTSRQGVDEFNNEVICIAKLQHRNLVKLLGWCSQGDEMMLVYEYMTNKSLNKILFDPTQNTLLDWPRRLNIINGIARGLMYLHQDSRLRVIHRDLKASNILLDSDMNPKISDFGLARTFGGSETGANTSRVVGTFGYMSPEYTVDGVFSVKSDVYSFGVLVLEIVSGKRNRGFVNKDHRLNLLGHAWMLYKEERSHEAVDSCLINSSYLQEIQRSIHIGLLCVQEYPEDRPGMASVVQMLSNDGPLPEAKRPGFFTTRAVLRTATSVSPSSTSSINNMSFTLFEAR
ncbi:hypothetical protein ACS0TY_017053 [Phlomoides rotata]